MSLLVDGTSIENVRSGSISSKLPNLSDNKVILQASKAQSLDQQKLEEKTILSVLDDQASLLSQMISGSGDDVKIHETQSKESIESKGQSDGENQSEDKKQPKSESQSVDEIQPKAENHSEDEKKTETDNQLKGENQVETESQSEGDSELKDENQSQEETGTKEDSKTNSDDESDEVDQSYDEDQSKDSNSVEEKESKGSELAVVTSFRLFANSLF